MSELLTKLTSYNLLNYLLTGALFAFIGTEVTTYTFTIDDLLLGIFAYYFYGLVISRLGSLILEPILKFTGFIEYVTYSDFIDAEKNDSKIETLLESNNIYRTFSTLFILIILMKAYEWIASNCSWINDNTNLIVLVILLLLFLFSFRKQTKFIVDRVNKSKSGSDKQ